MESVAPKDGKEDIRNGGAEEAAEKSWQVKAKTQRCSSRDPGAEQENGEFLLDRPCRADADDPNAPDETLDETDSGEQPKRPAGIHARTCGTEAKGERHLSGVGNEQQRAPERQFEAQEAVFVSDGARHDCAAQQSARRAHRRISHHGFELGGFDRCSIRHDGFLDPEA